MRKKESSNNVLHNRNLFYYSIFIIPSLHSMFCMSSWHLQAINSWAYKGHRENVNYGILLCFTSKLSHILYVFPLLCMLCFNYCEVTSLKLGLESLSKRWISLSKKNVWIQLPMILYIHVLKPLRNSLSTRFLKEIINLIHAYICYREL